MNSDKEKIDLMLSKLNLFDDREYNIYILIENGYIANKKLTKSGEILYKLIKDQTEKIDTSKYPID